VLDRPALRPPHTPTDQAPIESFFRRVKGEWPHLEQIRDPEQLRAELEVVRSHYNTVRRHAGIGYITPDDEHSGRGDHIRKARRQGLEWARRRRIAYHRKHGKETRRDDPQMRSDQPATAGQ
jgi:hypothetical protein